MKKHPKNDEKTLNFTEFFAKKWPFFTTFLPFFHHFLHYFDTIKRVKSR